MVWLTRKVVLMAWEVVSGKDDRNRPIARRSPVRRICARRISASCADVPFRLAYIGGSNWI